MSTAAAGNKYSFLGFYDEQNFNIGGQPTALSNGTSRGALRLLGIKEVPLAVPESELVNSTGDDGIIASFDFDSEEDRRYVATMAVDDLNLLSYLTNASVESIAGGDWIDYDIQDSIERSCWLIHQSRAKYQDNGRRGQKAWQGIAVKQATVKFLGRDTYNERAAATFRLSITPQYGTYDIHGMTAPKVAMFKKFESAYPYTMAAVRGDNVVTAFPLDYQPVEVAKTGLYVERVQRTVASVSTTLPYTAAASVAPALAARGSILYQFSG